MALKEVKPLQIKDSNSKLNGPSSHTLTRNRYLSKCVPLHKAALKGDWEAAKRILENEPSLIKDPITEGGETVLHIGAAAKHVLFVRNLVKMMNRSDLDTKNNIGNTALFFAAVTGEVKIAEMMVQQNDMLPMVRGSSRVMPLYMAAILGNKDMAEYLYPLSDTQSWTSEEKIELLTTCIGSCLYDLALTIIKDDHQLAVAEDKNGETPLHVLARKPEAFSAGNKGGLWKLTINVFLYWKHRILYTMIDRLSFQFGIKEQHRKNSTSSVAFSLLKCLWKHTLEHEDLEIPNLSKNTSRLLFIATTYGNFDFVVELLRAYPDFIWKVDTNNRSIFHTAVIHRHECIFSLIYEIGPVKELIATYRDNSNNNILHLAASLSPPNQLNKVKGAALQMQRELLWYKEVEKLVKPSYRDMENIDGETPANIFSKEHKHLLEEGSKWMRETAKSCMLVSTLIAVVVFTTSFTVPGGNNAATGRPILLKQNYFKIYSVSEATAMCCSLISVLMFLSILNSQYAEIDFLQTLPTRLVIGVATLFISLCALVVTFCTSFILSNGHQFQREALLFGSFACVPLVFLLLKYQVLLFIFVSMYESRFLFRSRTRLS